MPTYEYKCADCGHAFEKFQSITAAPLKQCPACGESGVKRLMGTGAGIIFKGGGFYETDYRSQNYKDSAKADKPSDGTSGDGTADKPAGKPPSGPAESKPAASKPVEPPPVAKKPPATPSSPSSKPAVA